MTLDEFAAATGADPKWYKPLTVAMQRFGINTPLQRAHFLAQIGHESGGFTRLVENLNYSAAALLRTWPTRFDEDIAARLARKPEMIANYVYGGRLGNTEPGDGWRYRGRGLVQLTGRANYEEACRAVGLPLADKPELLEEPEAAALSAAWYWSSRNLGVLADRDDLIAVTRRINGGMHGLDDRRKRLTRAKAGLIA